MPSLHSSSDHLSMAAFIHGRYSNHTSVDFTSVSTTSTHIRPQPHHQYFCDGSIATSTPSPPPNPCATSSCSAAQTHPSHLEEGQGESTCDPSVTRSQHRVHLDHHIRSSEYVDMDVATSAGVTSSQSRTVSLFGDDIEQEQEYFQQVLGSSSRGWTDEKHSSYLDSMEAQFLQCVLFNNRNSHQIGVAESSSELSDSASSRQAKTSDEFKVCQNGKWKSRKVGPVTHLAAAVRNPWIKRFRQSPKQIEFPSLLLDDPLFASSNGL